jgi:hypothetical protein
MSKTYYRNKRTGSYGVIEGYKFLARTGRGSSSLYKLRLLKPVEGIVELSSIEENVTLEELIEVSEDEALKVLLGLQ